MTLSRILPQRIDNNYGGHRLALVRYRAMVPLMLALFLFEHVARRVIFLVMPIPRDGTAPGLTINLALLAVMTVGLALSLRNRADQPLPR